MERGVEGGWLICKIHAPFNDSGYPLIHCTCFKDGGASFHHYGQLEQKREEEMKSTNIVSYLLLITSGCYVSHDALDFHVCPTFGQEVFD